MKGKTERQSVIRSLVRRENIANQEELLAWLEKEGLKVAQATLSRDLKEMGIAKVHDGKDYVFRLQHATVSPYGGPVGASSSLLSIQFSGNLAVMKTHPGHAGMIAASLDANASVPFIGTLAGDDTVLAILREKTSHEAVLTSLSHVFPDIKYKLLK